MLNITIIQPTDQKPGHPSEQAASEHFTRFLNRPCTVRYRMRANTPRPIIVIDGGLS